jgi:hypothetical protein
MKRILIGVVALLCFLSVKGQESFLGKSEQAIKDSLYKANYVMQVRKQIAATVVQLDFEYFDTGKHGDYEKRGTKDQIPNNTTPTATLTCIVEGGVCTRYIVGYMPDDVPAILKYLNRKYKNTEKDHWVDAKGFLEADAYTANDVFAIEFKRVEN